jgi:hypothetical protein
MTDFFLVPNYRLRMTHFVLVASPINGQIHVVVPGKIILFKAPCGDLPAGRSWMDRDGERHFSPAFYADLLCDLGVSLVIGADEAQYDHSPFAARGMDVEALGCRADDGNALTLQALDRLITLLDRAHGLVAIHCAGRLPYACTLLSAYMLRRRFFSNPAQAVSWLAMACPGACVRLPPAVLESLVAGPAAAAGLKLCMARSISHSHELDGLAGAPAGGGAAAAGGGGPSGEPGAATAAAEGGGDAPGASAAARLAMRVARSRRAMAVSASSPDLGMGAP